MKPDLAQFAKRLNELQNKSTGGNIAPEGIPFWMFALGHLSEEQRQILTSKSDDEIMVDLFDKIPEEVPPHMRQISESITVAHAFWEECTDEDFLKQITSRGCALHDALSDADPWVHIFSFMPLTRPELEFLKKVLALGDTDAVYSFFFGTSYGDWSDDPGRPEIQAVDPLFNDLMLYNRMETAYHQWEESTWGPFGERIH